MPERKKKVGPKLFAVELFTEFIQSNLRIKPFLCVDRFSKDDFLFFYCYIGSMGANLGLVAGEMAP